MKPRFDIRFPSNGPYTPPQGNALTPPQRYTGNDRPSPNQVPISDENSNSTGIDADLAYKLEDEIQLSELEDYTTWLISLLTNEQKTSELRIADLLPSYARLQTEHADARQNCKDQQNLAKQLVKATEPLLSNGAIAEQEKQSLLSVTGLAVEKVMQLKMRSSNLRKRVNLLQQTIPQYVENYATLLGHPVSFCQQLARETKSAL